MVLRRPVIAVEPRLNHSAKLSPEDVLEVYALAKVRRYSQREIAAGFGTSQSNVSTIRHKKSWAWLWDEEG